DVAESRVGDGTEDVVEKRASDRHHRLDPRAGDRGLALVEAGGGIGTAHARAEAAGEDHRFGRRRSHDAVVSPDHIRGSRRISPTALMRKKPRKSTPWVVRP